MIRIHDSNIYGRDARASLLADYVELLALKGQPVSRETVADFLADNEVGWDFDLIQAPGNDHPDEGDGLAEHNELADERASIVFRQIEERRKVLAEHYPFRIADGQVSIDPGVDRESNAYVAVLALTVAHAFGVAAPTPPLHELFEETVTGVLQARGLCSVEFAALVRRHNHNFKVALTAACREIGLVAAPNAVARRKKARDEGVDVLCHLGWEQDLRPGSWGFIGQVTVAKSDEWTQKIKEPDPGSWRGRLGTRVPPMPFLAVPHHVERQTMEWLTGEGPAIVLDRLRLVRFKEEIKANELEIIRAVAKEEVEPLT